MSVYHNRNDQPADSLLRLGYSKDHRPDRVQFKAMLSSLDARGLPVAAQVVPGNRADDGLYIPADDACASYFAHPRNGRSVSVRGCAKSPAHARPGGTGRGYPLFRRSR